MFRLGVGQRGKDIRPMIDTCSFVHADWQTSSWRVSILFCDQWNPDQIRTYFVTGCNSSPTNTDRITPPLTTTRAGHRCHITMPTPITRHRSDPIDVIRIMSIRRFLPRANWCFPHRTSMGQVDMEFRKPLNAHRWSSRSVRVPIQAAEHTSRKGKRSSDVATCQLLTVTRGTSSSFSCVAARLWCRVPLLLLPPPPRSPVTRANLRSYRLMPTQRRLLADCRSLQSVIWPLPWQQIRSMSLRRGHLLSDSYIHIIMSLHRLLMQTRACSACAHRKWIVAAGALHSRTANRVWDFKFSGDRSLKCQCRCVSTRATDWVGKRRAHASSSCWQMSSLSVFVVIAKLRIGLSVFYRAFVLSSVQSFVYLFNLSCRLAVKCVAATLLWEITTIDLFINAINE